MSRSACLIRASPFVTLYVVTECDPSPHGLSISSSMWTKWWLTALCEATQPKGSGLKQPTGALSVVKVMVADCCIFAVAPSLRTTVPLPCTVIVPLQEAWLIHGWQFGCCACNNVGSSRYAP